MAIVIAEQISPSNHCAGWDAGVRFTHKKEHRVTGIPSEPEKF